MCPEPLFKRLCAPSRQYLHDLVLLKVNQDSAVAMAFAEGPIIDAEHPGSRLIGDRDTRNEAQQSGCTGGHPPALNDPGPRLTSQRKGQNAEDRHKARRPPSVRSDDVWQPFGEDPPRASRLAAVELADTQVESDRLATPWQVSDRPLVVAVDRLGPRSAVGARPSRGRGLKSGDDPVRSDRDVSKLEAVPEREQVCGEGASAWHRSKSYRPPSPYPPKSRESPDWLHRRAVGLAGKPPRQECETLHSASQSNTRMLRALDAGPVNVGRARLFRRVRREPKGGPLWHPTARDVLAAGSSGVA
jgi:hypothetical protein